MPMSTRAPRQPAAAQAAEGAAAQARERGQEAVDLPARRRRRSSRSTPVSRDQLKALNDDPPEWLATLRRDGPHPRSEVARRLGISNSGLARAGQPDVMTTAEIKQLLVEMPEWLVAERARMAATRPAL